MAELITIKGVAQEEGKQIKGYMFPDKIENFPIPSKVSFAPNYSAVLYDKTTNRSTGKTYPTINIVDKSNDRLFTDNGLYLKWMPKGNAFGKTQMLLSIPPTTIPASATIRPMPTAPTPISKTPLETENKNSTGTKYKILKTNKFSEPPFKVGDIVEGTLDSNGFLVVKRDFEGNKNVQFQFAKDEFEQVGSTTTSGSASGEKVTKSDKSDFWSLKNPFHYTVIAGAIIGFFYAKNKAKNILASTLIGAGIGGGLGIVANKFMGKKTTTSTKSSGDKAGSGSSDKVTDDKLIDAMINSMRQMVVSLAVTFGQDKAKAEADFNTDFEKQKPQVIAKGKEVLATMNDNEKQAVYEMILFETDLYSKAKTQEDAEKIEPQLNSKIQELSTKYSVDLKAAIDKLKGQKF